MQVLYVVLYDHPEEWETEIVGVFENKEDAETCARDNDKYRIEEW